MDLYPLRYPCDAQHSRRVHSVSSKSSIRARHDPVVMQKKSKYSSPSSVSVSAPLAINIAIIYCGRCGVPPSLLTPSHPERESTNPTMAEARCVNINYAA